MKNKYEIQETDYGVTWINVLQKNSRGETIKICITECKNRGGKHALPVLWYQAGYTKKIFKTYEECLKRLQSEEDKYAAYIKAHDLSTFKSVLITCKKCGSKLNKDYLKRSCCPLCKNDLRSNTVKAASDRYEEKIRKLKKDIQTEEAKASGKAVLRYLVMYEEYCG